MLYIAKFNKGNVTLLVIVLSYAMINKSRSSLSDSFTLYRPNGMKGKSIYVFEKTNQPDVSEGENMK